LRIADSRRHTRPTWSPQSCYLVQANPAFFNLQSITPTGHDVRNRQFTMIRVGILTVSDRSARGERADSSGPALMQVVGERLPEAVVAITGVVPDNQAAISGVLVEWSDRQQLDLILTTGGTGFAPRDVTPEATRAILHREAPGLAEAMRAESLRVTSHAALSRAVAGIRGRTLILNLPGSPKAAVENLATLLPVLPHAVELLQEAPEAESHHVKRET
jgi:molybdopterin adenylyltransferase